MLTVCVTVALGAMALILADGFIDRTFFLFREDIIRSHFAHLQVVPESADSKLADDAPVGDLRRIVERSLVAYPGAVVAGRLSFSGLIAYGELTVGFLGEGIEPVNEASMSKALVVSAGRPLDEDDTGKVLLGEGLAKSIGAEVGDRVTLLANLPGGGVNAIEVVVGGIFHTATKAYDDRALRLPIDAARQLTREKGVSKLLILLPETDDAAAAADTLRPALTDHSVKLRLWTELADFYNKTVELFSRQLGFVRTVILFIVLLATSNAMARNVLEQQREIGTMMALGARRGAVARKYIGQALVMGVVGGLAGVVLGGVVAAIVTRIGIPMPPPPGTAHGFTGGISFSAASAVSALLSVLAVSLLASVLPALRASRVTIVDALRADR